MIGVAQSVEGRSFLMLVVEIGANAVTEGVADAHTDHIIEHLVATKAQHPDRECTLSFEAQHLVSAKKITLRATGAGNKHTIRVLRNMFNDTKKAWTDVFRAVFRIGL